MKKLKSRRWNLVALAVLVLVAGLAAVPAVQAAKPVRSALQLEAGTLQAGYACPFDVEVAPNARARGTLTEFADGRTVMSASGGQTITNLETGNSIAVNLAFTWTERWDEATNDLSVEVSGQEVFFFYPGDQGPLGLVGDDGALFHVTGRVKETWDLDTDVITSFSYSGKAVELCSKLS